MEILNKPISPENGKTYKIYRNHFHNISSSGGGAYHEYAKELLKAGFAVLAPMNLMSVERRNRIERLCRLA